MDFLRLPTVKRANLINTMTQTLELIYSTSSLHIRVIPETDEDTHH